MPAVPAEPQTLVYCLCCLAFASETRAGAASATRARRLASLAIIHRFLRLVETGLLPTLGRMVRDTPKAIRRDKRQQQGQAASLCSGAAIAEGQAPPSVCWPRATRSRRARAGEEGETVASRSAHSLRVGLSQDLFAVRDDGRGNAVAVKHLDALVLIPAVMRLAVPMVLPLLIVDLRNQAQQQQRPRSCSGAVLIDFVCFTGAVGAVCLELGG